MRDLARQKLRVAVAAVLAVIIWGAASGAAHAAVTFNNWSSSGPTPAPTKAVVKVLAISPTTPQATLYAGTDGGGVYTMSDGGTSWSPGNLGLTNRQIQALAVHPVDPRVVYAATKDGLFRTGDGAVSWTPASSGLASSDVRALAIDPQTPSILYAGGPAGVAKSVNDGASWSAVNTGLTSQNVRALVVDPSAPATLYAGTDGGVFQSLDSGAHWSAVNTGLNNTDVLCLAWAATTPPSIMAGTNGGGVFVTTDAGATWAADNPSLGSLSVQVILLDNPAAPGIAYAGTANGLYKQTYTSGSWNVWNAAAGGITVPAVVHALVNVPTLRSTLYAGTDLGAFRSVNSAGTWSALATGLRQGSALAVKPTDSTIVVAGLSGGGVYRSSDGASSWVAATSTLPSTPTAFLFDPAGTPAYAASGSGVYKSTDDGATWALLGSGLASTDVRTLAFGAAGALHAGTAEGVFVYNNGLDTWGAYGGGQPPNLNVTALAYRGTSLFAGTNGGGVYRSDAGGSWSQVNGGLTNTVINALALDGSHVFAATASGVFRSADNGASWSAVNTGITNLNVKALGLASGNPAFLTSGTNGGGVFFTTNAGDVWIPMNVGLTDKAVGALAANSATKKVLAATASAKIFGLKLSPVSAVSPAGPADFGIVNVNDSKPTVFTLSNTGTLQLNVSSITLSGLNSGLFSIAAGGSRQCALPAPVVIEAGDYCTVAVNFVPTTTGTKTASLVVGSDAPNQPVSTALLGMGGFPPVASITTPAGGTTVRNPVTISGTAIDKNQTTGADGTGANLVKVEISTDSGSTWNLATKNTTLNSWTQWSYNWGSSPLPANGPYQVFARATDSNGIVQSAYSIISLIVDNVPPFSAINSKPPALSNSASGSFSFTTDKPGSTTQCTLDGVAAPCGSPYFYSGLADGNHTFSILSTDQVGNVELTPKSYSWVTDTTAPVTSITSFPALYTTLTDASIAFTSTEPGSSFRCTLDGVSAACLSPRLYTNLADGTHVFTVQATDAAGNTAATAPTTQSYSWTVDKNSKPTATVNAPGAPLTGIGYSFSGTAADSVSGVRSVGISLNGGAQSPANDLAVGPALPFSTWNFSWSLPVNGAYTLQALAVDNAGNLQASPASIIFLVANPLPVVALTAPADASLIGSGSPRIITGTAQQAPSGLPLQKVQVAVFPTANPPGTLTWNDASGTTNWSYNWQFPVDGNYTIQARALDVAPALDGTVVGNASQVVSRTVTIDTVPPVAAITPLTNPYLTGHLVTLSGTADDPVPGSGIRGVDLALVDRLGQVVSSGAANYNSGTKSWVYTSSTLVDGSYTVQATAIDNAGNRQAVAATSSVTIDNLAPVTTLSARPPALSNQPFASFSFSAGEPSSFICTLDGASAACSSCGSTPVTSCTQTYTGLTNGSHLFSVRAVDPAGNQELTGQSASWSVDLVPPRVTATTPADGTSRISVAIPRITVSFSKDLEPASVTAGNLFLDHGATGQLTWDPATRTATLVPDAPLAYATTYTVTASTGLRDPAGNALTGTYHFSFSTDPDGDVNLDGKVDLVDAMLCLQMAVGLVTPTAEQIKHGDLAPFRNGKPQPDGKLDASDALIILSKTVGLVRW